MKIKKVGACSILDSRKQKTIQVFVKTSRGKFRTASPSGKSTGRYEAKPYKTSLSSDISYINKLDLSELNSILKKTTNKSLKVNQAFLVLEDIERLVRNKIGANTLFALEASLLKALAHEQKKQLWQFLGGKKKSIRSVGNAIGGGLHSSGKKPDFQEFLFIPNCKSFAQSIKINKIAHKLAGRLLKSKTKNDEGAWQTSASAERILIIMKKIQQTIRKKYKTKIDIGLDIAASSFYNGKYNYKNPKMKLTKSSQINYIKNLINSYGIFYVEDPLSENDFSGFAELRKKTQKANCLIVGDDLTTTNPERLKKAIKARAINSIIIKPNQIGSLIKVKEVAGLAKKSGIKTIISHRSGETTDSTIADLGVGLGCDFIKTGISGSVRESKLRRVRKISN